MILVYGLLIPLLIICLWIFFKSSPKQINPSKIKLYNFGTIILAIAVSVAYSLKLRTAMINDSDFPWWPVLSFMFSLLISVGIIFTLGILRNLLIFRNNKR